MAAYGEKPPAYVPAAEGSEYQQQGYQTYAPPQSAYVPPLGYPPESATSVGSIYPQLPVAGSPSQWQHPALTYAAPSAAGTATSGGGGGGRPARAAGAAGAAGAAEELVALPVVGPTAVRVVCPYCRHTVVTKVKHTAGVLTWLLFGLLLVIGFWMLCCLIPFCVKRCQDVIHTCPNCRQVIGKYHRL